MYGFLSTLFYEKDSIDEIKTEYMVFYLMRQLFGDGEVN